VVEEMQPLLPVDPSAIKKGLSQVILSSRLKIIPGEVTEIWDVSHNAGSVQLLAEKLKSLSCGGKTIGVFSMLADKDLDVCVNIIKREINVWCIAALKTTRAATLHQLQTTLNEQGITEIISFTSIKEAYQYAKSNAVTGDRLVIFGSFHTVAEGEGNGCTQKGTNH
jgi:dihydrofolate synthase/folylpolyglutamate synthase